MGAKLGPRIVADNLVLALDCADAKSYPGEPVNNLVTSTAVDFSVLSTYNNNTFSQVVDSESPSGYACEMSYTGTVNTSSRCRFGASTSIPTSGSGFVSIWVKRSEGPSTTMRPSVYTGYTWYTLAPLDGGSDYITEEYRPFGVAVIFGTNSGGPNPGFSMTRAGNTTVNDKTRWIKPQVTTLSYNTPFANLYRSAITSLLIHSNVSSGTSFEDSSPNKFTVTNTGLSGNLVTRSSSVVKFGSESLNFGSANTQYLEISDDDEFHFNTSDFTIEAWIYPLDFGDYRGIYHQGESSGNGYMNSLELKSTGALRWLIRNASTTVLDITTNASTLTANTWQHIAATREGNYFKLWINGVLSKTSGFISTALDNLTYDVHIGNRVIGGTPTYQYYGYMDEVRVTNGTALYTAAFSPPTERFKNGAWLDTSGNENNGNFINGLDTGTSHYRDGDVILPNSARYLDFDGTDQYITISSLLNQETINGSTTKTIILWLNADSYGSKMPFSTGQNGNNRIYYWTQSSLNTWRIGNYTSTTDHSTLPSAGTWFCTAIVINGLSVTGYLNGVQDYTGSYTAFTTQDFAVLGRHGNLTGVTDPYYYDGKIGQVLVYNEALTATEILNNYNSTKSRFS